MLKPVIFNNKYRVFRNPLLLGVIILSITIIIAKAGFGGWGTNNALTVSSPALTATNASGEINTATPDLSKSETPNPTPRASITPIPITNSIDLAPGLDNSRKAFVYVERSNGSFDLFTIRPEEPISNAIELNPGDKIYGVVPPSFLMGAEPILVPTSTNSIPPTSSPTGPYPASP